MSVKMSAGQVSRDSNEELDAPLSEIVHLKPIIRKAIPEEDKFREIHILAYCLSAVLGREYSGWNSTLSSGFGMFAVAQLLTAGACVCYYLCLCEIWSAIPFSGGSYGLSRASLGFYIGFLDGCCEALVYVAHSAISAMALSAKLVLLLELNSHYLLLFCFIFYSISVWLTIQRDLKVLRRAYMTLATVTMIILLMYLLGMLKYVDFLKNAPLKNSRDVSAFDNWFVGGMNQFMFILPLSVTPYAGFKSFALLTIVAKEPKRTIPNAVIIGVTTIFAVNMLDIFVFASQPGGILATSALAQPMVTGNSLLFNLNNLSSLRVTTLLSLPGSFSKLLTYILPVGNLFHCLGNSYYLPPILCINKTQDRTNGCIVCAVFGMLLCVIIHFNPSIDLYNVCILATMITCCTFIYSYIMLRTTYSNVERSFISPLGIPGAVFGFTFYAIIGVSAAFFQKTWFNVEFAAVCFVVLTVYYYTIARRGERLGEEEDKVFFQLHVRNYNKNKKKRMRKAATTKKVVPVDSHDGSERHSLSLISLVFRTKAGSKDTTTRRPQQQTDPSAGTAVGGTEICAEPVQNTDILPVETAASSFNFPKLSVVEEEVELFAASRSSRYPQSTRAPEMMIEDHNGESGSGADSKTDELEYRIKDKSNLGDKIV